MRIAALVFLLLSLLSRSAVAEPIVQTSISQGALRGVKKDTVSEFLGIPYAAPPVADNRWRAPLPAPSWTGNSVADHFSPACYQRLTPNGFGPWTPEYITQDKVSEDCLYLNVWTPAQSKSQRLPVLFWIYGGGFNSGAGSVPVYNGQNLAKKGIIVVTFNFRVGALGFLAHPELTAESPNHASGNYGMLDIIAALKWVRANIESFGGDPNAVTIAGQSSGSGAVNYLHVSPLSRGLFARAIAESGVRIGNSGPTLKETEEKGQKFAASLGVTSIKALRALSPERLLESAPQGQGQRFSVIFDGYVLPKAPIDMIKAGDFARTAPVLTGYTAEEQSGQNPKWETMTLEECKAYIDGAGTYTQRLRDAYLTMPHSNCYEDLRALGRDRNLMTSYDWALIRLSNGSAPTYTYLFNHTEPGPDSKRWRAFHTVEVPYVFNNLDISPERPFTQEDRDIADKSSSYWINFIKTGNPNGPGLPSWPAVNADHPQTMELGGRFGARPVIADPDRFTLMKGYLDSDEGRKTVFEGALPFSR